MPHGVENPCVTPDSPKTLLIAYLTETLSGSQLTHILYVIHAIHYILTIQEAREKKMLARKS